MGSDAEEFGGAAVSLAQDAARQALSDAAYAWADSRGNPQRADFWAKLAEAARVFVASERHAPAPPGRTPSGASRSGPVFRFGRQNGQPLAGAERRDLEWYRSRIEAGMDDPDKARFRDDNLAHLAEIDEALS